jgi:hypothetical protein
MHLDLISLTLYTVWIGAGGTCMIRQRYTYVVLK